MTKKDKRSAAKDSAARRQVSQSSKPSAYWTTAAAGAAKKPVHAAGQKVWTNRGLGFPDEKVLPPGASGTITDVLGEGAAYRVRFDDLAGPDRVVMADEVGEPAMTTKGAAGVAALAGGFTAVQLQLSTAPEANTVVYIHGINNKPLASVLKCQWDVALFGRRVGDRTRMAYWVDRSRYPTASPGTCGTADLIEPIDDDADSLGVSAMDLAPVDLQSEVNALTTDPAARKRLKAIARELERHSGDTEAAAEFAAMQVGAKVLPLPPFLRRRITRRLTRRFLADVHDFLFVKDKREGMERALRERLEARGGPFVVIAHSQGSMIAYNVLRTLKKADCDVKLFITIGSPLGLAEVQDVLRTKEFAGQKQLPFPPCVHRWVNVADRLDPVSADTRLANDSEHWEKVIDYTGLGINRDSPRHPHSGTGYLRTGPVRRHVYATAGNNFDRPLEDFTIATDLVAELEDAGDENRRPVLIELKRAEPGTNLDSAHRQIGEEIIKLVLQTHRSEPSVSKKKLDEMEAADLCQLEHLERFVSANLTRREAEFLSGQHKELEITTLWRNARKTALILDSVHTVHAHTAHLGYDATGDKIHWAVIDSGIFAGHPHFEAHQNVQAQWDCLARGRLPLDPAQQWKGTGDRRLDGNGHGTHVAGIIAGEYRDRVTGNVYRGMAPRTKLHVYRALDDQGNGSDASIIKALDHIAGTNEKSGGLVIHGVNLSLGGDFDPSVFGCGHTPLCRELQRLWRQGVVVVLAAGNEGTLDMGGRNVNLDLSICDPANLEEAICVGSVHKLKPHTYGISYFSSRGPTADGRQKPDCVAPGEKILSACHRAKKPYKDVDELYIEMDGTSMAAPHVSGILAAYMSRRTEFIGHPDRLKQILLAHCIDLGRERHFQGAGMPNLVQMLAST